MSNKYKPEGLQHKSDKDISLKFINKMCDVGGIIEARVTKSDAECNLYITLGKNIAGIIPFDEVEYSVDNKPIKPIAATSKVGRHIKFKIMSIEQDGDNIIAKCSRREAQKECYEEFINKLEPGDVIDARAIHIENYGVFCDIGCGIIALLPTENVCISHILEPKNELISLKEMKAVVKSRTTDNRIVLTHKELLGTWEQGISKFKAGETVKGKVRSIESYGVFISISQNITGLADPYDGVKVGDEVIVNIINIYREQMKTKLNIIDIIGKTDTVEKIKFDYYITDGHISHWKYSVDGAKRNIETIFDDYENNYVSKEE